MDNLGNRIVVLIDMDCFFCQVETRLNPELAGKPLAVVQYNQWKLGGIIAVNYEARDFGVTRHMRGEEAKEKCPQILLASVPCLRGKADTSRYRSAGREVIEVLKKNCNMVERASVDEAYLDITQIVDDKLSKGVIESDNIFKELENTYIVGYSENSVNNEEQKKKGLESWISEASEDVEVQRLAIAGAIVENIRKDIFNTTGFRSSAGISFNKILAKLACGLHKPNCQTILPASAVPDLYGTLPVKKVRNLGGKLGDMVIDSLKCNVMADLLPYSLQFLQNRFDEKTGLWLYNIARGIDNEPVTPRLVSKSIGACKKFPGKQAIVDMEVLKHWVKDLCDEVCERLEQDLEENERRASLLTVSFQYYQNKSSVSQSRSCPLSSYKLEKVAEQCLNIVVKATQQQPISFLGISAGKFIKAKGSENFVNFFKTNVNDKVASTSNVEENKALVNMQDNILSGISNNNDKTAFKKIEENFKNTESETDQTHFKFSDKKQVNRRSSPCSKIKKSLKTDNFKKSFFMNILKEKQSKSNLEIEEKSNKDNLNTSNSNDEYEENLISNINEDSKKETKINSISTDNEYGQSTSTNCNDMSVGLQEIFPNLNDIDLDVVRLLPLHLQQEAKKLLKENDAQDKSIEMSKKKCKESDKISKEKNSKSKGNNHKSNIQNFFIKTDINNISDRNLKKCPLCEQLILIDKLNEHNDYHIAQNLQKEMNQISNQDEIRKRKVVLDNPNYLKKRLSDEIVNSSVRNTNSIQSFFQ